MISASDTTATDVLCERCGIANINARMDRLDIAGLRPLASLIQLDRRHWWLRDRDVGFLPEFAFSLYQRQCITARLNELCERVPTLSRLTDTQTEAS